MFFISFLDFAYIFHTFLQKVPNHFLHFSSKSPKILTFFIFFTWFIMILQCYISWFMFLMIFTWFFIIWSWFTGFLLSFLAFWQSRKALTEVNSRRPRTSCTTALKILKATTQHNSTMYISSKTISRDK